MQSKDYAVDLMLDSGVFSAWNKDETLDLKRYMQYLKDHKKWLWSYVNMDVIPGKYGQRRTQKEVEDSASQGYDNLQTMKGEGLKPIPVFHQGERFYWLERMIADGERYIGISTAKDLWAQEQARWLDHVFSMITDSAGRPLIRTHGFGVTNTKLLLRYPFYTVDSTTWSLTPGYGQIIVPVYERGKPNYLRPPVRIAVSGVVHQATGNQKMQFEAMGPLGREMVLRFLNEDVGVSLAQARYGTTIRRRCVLVYFRELVKHLEDVRFKHSSDGMLSAHLPKLPGLKPTGDKKLRIMFATSLSREWSATMNDVGSRTRLLSYYELKDKSSETLTEYVERGILGEYVKKPYKQNWNETYNNHRRLSLVARLESYENDGTDAVS